MPNIKKIDFIVYIKIIAAIIVWGGSFIATKIAVREVSPITVVWLRFLIGIIILAIFARSKNELSLPGWKDVLELVWLGFLGITLHQWLQSSGLVTSDASTSAWLVSTTPVFIALLGWIFLKEKIGWKTSAGILLASIGVLLVVSKGHIQSIFNGRFGKRGDILLLISAPNWAIYSVLSKPILKRFSSIKVTFYVLFFGWMLTNVQFLTGHYWIEFRQLTAAGWASIAFLGIFCSALAYILYNDGLKALSTSQVGVFLYLEPLAAMLIAALVLSENIVLASLVGGGLILLGVWLVNRNLKIQDM